MHILIIPSEEYIPKHAPIAGIFQHDQAKILQQHGHQVGVLSFSFKYSVNNLLNVLVGKKIKFTKELSPFNALKQLLIKIIFPYKSSLTTEMIDGIKVLRCDGFIGTERKLSSTVLYNLWTNYGMFALQEYIKQHGKPDVIHAHNMIYAGLTYTAIGKQFIIPVVITEHSTEFALEDQPKAIAKKITIIIKQQNNLYAVSPKLIELLNFKFFNGNSSKIKWLPNVLDTKFEENITFIPKAKGSKVRFFNLSNLIPVKGQKDLIYAFSQAFHEVNDVELLIAGNGILKNELEELINELGIKNKVKLIGLIDRNEVVKQMDSSDVFVLPSHYETFGVVLIEALSRGVPVISTYCGGPECIVNDKNGILVTPKNKNELADALLKMYNTHTQYDKIALRNECLSLYGKDNFYTKIIEIYKTAIKTT